MKSASKTLAAIACPIICVLFTSALTVIGQKFALAQSTEVVEYFFGFQNDGGLFPQDTLIRSASDGNFYGTAADGGASEDGAVFKISTSGTFTPVFGFSGSNGSHPQGPVTEFGTSNTYYGMTEEGGAHNMGTVFRVNSTGSPFTSLHSFGSSASDGAYPFGGVIFGSDGNIYGMTQNGGSTGDGVIFKMTTSGTETILHTFDDGSVTNDGTNPFASLVQASDGDFYGTTKHGGSVGDGTVFKMTPAGVVTILHSFGDGTVTNDGIVPACTLIQATDGNLYGTTFNGGANGDGTVFKITTSGTVTILYSFAGYPNDGSDPYAGLLQGSDGNFYGMTSEGGTPDNAGIAFELNSAGTETILHTFPSNSDDGVFPFGGLVEGPSGSLWGMTSGGGQLNNGIIFKLVP